MEIKLGFTGKLFLELCLNLETTENEMKDRIKEKLILGIQNHS